MFRIGQVQVVEVDIHAFALLDPGGEDQGNQEMWPSIRSAGPDALTQGLGHLQKGRDLLVTQGLGKGGGHGRVYEGS